MIFRERAVKLMKNVMVLFRTEQVTMKQQMGKLILINYFWANKVIIYSRVQADSTLMVVAQESGIYTCMGCNENCEVSQVKVFVTTLPEGFQISGPTRTIEGDSINLTCAASKYNYTDNSLVWYKQTTNGYKQISTAWGKSDYKNITMVV